MIFLVTVAVALSQGGISDLQTPPGHPQLRVAHFAADAGPLDVRIGGGALVDGLTQGTVPGYETLPPGDYEVELLDAEDGRSLLRESITLEAGQRSTLIIQGTGAPALSLVADEAEAGSLRVYNAWDDEVSLVDFASELSDEDTIVLAGEIGRGGTVSAAGRRDGHGLQHMGAGERGGGVAAGARGRGGRGVQCRRRDSALLVLAPVRRFEGSLEATANLLGNHAGGRLWQPGGSGPEAVQPLHVADCKSWPCCCWWRWWARLC